MNTNIITNVLNQRNLCILAFVGFLLGISGCRAIYNFPEEKEFLSTNISYATKYFEPVLGRTSYMGALNADNSSHPMTFEIVNARFGDGRPCTDLFQVKPVYVWKEIYTAREKSLAEIEAKRNVEQRPIFEVDASGRFILWNSSSNENVTPRAKDSVDLTQNRRFFDLKISNSGGSVILKDFTVIPWRVRDYEPSSDINPYTGDVAPDPKEPKNPRKRDYIRPSEMTELYGQVSNKKLVTNDDLKDLVVYIRRFEGGNGNNLRFVFWDKNGMPINPDNFNETKWNKLVHGFNMVKTNTYVQYDVAYPVPLSNNDSSREPSFNSEYTSGENARVRFAYTRKGFGGNIILARFGLDFKIFTKGDWEIIFHFRNDNPRFDNE
ncbi:DUF5007 domain-containing protein [Sphingobacterium sp. Mn56C]|uniref:DUF5007 domain-containing protein n=1 Tax=Sphingobacterium sp. Mn56C TaxID=3395261 RepID=UPI003BEE41FF